MSENFSIWKSQLENIRRRFGEAIEEVRMPESYPTDVPIIFVKHQHVVKLLSFLKFETDFDYTFLADLTATDEFPKDPRFEVVYNLYSIARHLRIRVKTRVAEAASIPSITSIWAGANWAECEVFDMFGIPFEGHPGLRRILNHEEFIGYPMRKDYYISKYQIFSEAEPVHPERLK